MRTLHYVVLATALVGILLAPLAAPGRAEEEVVAAPVEATAPEDLTATEAVAQAPELLLFQEIPIVVTASRMEQRVTEAPASVSVITREQILNSGAISIPDLLRMVPGVDVAQVTASTWEVSTRGFAYVMANKVLVLIDGRTVYNDFYANTDWYALPVVLEDIERIEVIRGPLSSLWGANALLGVINIITRSPAQAQGTLATAQYGTRGTFRVNAVYGGATTDSRVRYKVVAAREEVGQWSAQLPEGDSRKDLVTQMHGGATTKATVAAEWSDRGGGQWNLSTGINDGYVMMVIGLRTRQRKWEDTTKYLSLSYEQDDLQVRAYWNGSRVYMTDDAIVGTALVTDLYDVEALKSNIIGRHSLVYGAGFRRKELGQSGETLVDGPHSQNLWAAYVEDSYQAPGRTKLVLGARYDRHPLTGGSLSGRATAMYSLTDNQTLRLSAATAFRSPNFLESYLAMVWGNVPPPLPPAGLFGNTDLDNEGATSYDLEYRAQLSSRTSFDAAVYRTQVTNFIQAALVPETPWRGTMMNLGAVRASGVEVEVQHLLSPVLSAFANYTYQDLEGDASVANTEAGMIMPLMSPRHKANLGFTLSDPEHGWNGSLLLNYRTKEVIVDTNSGPYLLVNGYLGKKVANGAEVGVSFYNLGNYKTYQIGNGDYIGRRIMGSVRWEF